MISPLRAWRKFRGLTLEQVAAEAETDAGQISKLETGARRLNQTWIDKLSNVYGCSPAELLEAPELINESEEHLLDAYRAMTPEQRQALLSLAKSFVTTPPGQAS